MDAATLIGMLLGSTCAENVEGVGGKTYAREKRCRRSVLLLGNSNPTEKELFGHFLSGRANYKEVINREGNATGYYEISSGEDGRGDKASR